MKRPSQSGPRFPRLLQTAAIGVSAKAVGAVCNVITIPILLANLGQSNWALISFQTVVQTVLSWCEFGLPSVGAKELAQRSRQDSASLFGTLETLSIVLALVSTALAAVILWAVAYEEFGGASSQNVSAITLMSVSTGINILNVFYTNCAIGLGKFEHVSSLSIVSTIARAVLGSAITYVSPNVSLYLATQCALNIVLVVLLKRMIDTHIGATERCFLPDLVRANAKFASAIAASSLLLGCGIQGDKILLARIFSAGELPGYLVGFTIGTFCFAMLSVVIGSRTRLILSEVDPAKQKATSDTVSLLWSIGALIPCVLIIAGDLIIKAWLSRTDVNTAHVVSVARIIAVGWVFYSQFQLNVLRLTRQKIARTQIIGAGLGLVIYVFALIALTSLFGATGAALAFCIYSATLYGVTSLKDANAWRSSSLWLELLVLTLVVAQFLSNDWLLADLAIRAAALTIAWHLMVKVGKMHFHESNASCAN